MFVSADKIWFRILVPVPGVGSEFYSPFFAYLLVSSIQVIDDGKAGKQTILVLSSYTYIQANEDGPILDVRFHETSLLILSLLIILDYFMTDYFYNIVFKR